MCNPPQDMKGPRSVLRCFFSLSFFFSFFFVLVSICLTLVFFLFPPSSQMLRALEAVHELGYLHRDVKVRHQKKKTLIISFVQQLRQQQHQRLIHLITLFLIPPSRPTTLWASPLPSAPPATSLTLVCRAALSWDPTTVCGRHATRRASAERRAMQGRGE